MALPALSLHVASTNATPSDAYTYFTFPCPKGRLSGTEAVGIEGERRMLQAQSWPLAYWPDGSARAIQGIAPLAGGNYQIKVGADLPAVNGLCAERGEEGRIKIDLGSEQVLFNREMLFSNRFDLDVSVVWADGSVGLLELEGDAVLRKEGPLYMQVERWVKIASGQRWLRFRFQFEIFHGIPGMAVNVMLVHDCPGHLFQEIRSIEFHVKQAGAAPVVFQENYGFEYLESRFVETTEAVDIRVDHTHFLPFISNIEVLKDENIYPHYLRPPANRTGSAIFLKGGRGVLQMEMEDFHLLRPKGILLEPGQAAFALWPKWAEPLRLQQGRRRQMRLALYWGHREVPASQAPVKSASAALLEVHRAQLPSDAYSEAEFFDQSRVLSFRPDLYPRLEGWLQAVSSLRTVAEFFHLGDTPDRRYQTTYSPLGYSRRKCEGLAPLCYTTSGRNGLYYEHLEDYEPIWVNNEYDVIFALGTEFLRSGNMLLYRQLRWFARHTVEVDFVCYSDFPITHRAQPAHSEDHTSTGAYPSHFWTQGLAQYYFLNGDEDALEVIHALADKTIWYFEHPKLGGLHSGVNREMGWAVLTLVSAFEATGERKYNDYARKLIDAAIGEPLPVDLPNFNFGHTSLLLGCRAYLEAQEDSEGPVWEWYLSVLNLAIRSSRTRPESAGNVALKLSYDYDLAERGEVARTKPRPGVLNGFAAPDCLAYAYERTGDTTYLEAGIRSLQAFLDGNPGYNGFSTFHHPLPEGNPFAIAYRTWINYFGALDRAGWLKAFDYPTLPFNH